MLPTTITHDFVKGLPKAELHLHLEGTLEPELKLALAQRNRIDIGQGTIEEIKRSYRFDSLSSFLQVYYPAMNVLQQEEDFYQLAMAYLHKAREHNVRYVELFFDPQAHTSRGIAFATVIDGYHRAVRESPALGVESALVMCFLRDMSAQSAADTLEQALPYREQILGIGLDSDENGNPPGKFKEVFEKARQAGFHLTMHCDIDQHNSIGNIRQALLDIQVDRLDHGTNIVEDQELVAYVRDKGIGLTCCPVSNGFVGDMKGNEILQLLRAGVKVTVNSDDPAYFQSYVSDDMFALAQSYSMTPAEMVQLARNSFEVSWLPAERKAAYLRQITDYVDAW
ncbi:MULTISPECIES: adenosine deaminase [unclassified Pseudomonas]|uniref:adenosine deaminase n=1 Tax=unclassified Pseudomonas TaxID=196821 RepID=UPI000CD14FAD|nr:MULTISPECIES: adenosine deaminase [unclassified Pseudomonas]POA56763.1 adenosine deaminase [Pseudomonas sp. FW507-12TSA]